MRTKNTIINAVAAVSSRYLSSILGFVSRTVFIKVLGITYLGVNSLFSDVFMMLSLMELGVGPAMTFFLYKPMSEKKHSEINSLIKTYSKLYRYIGMLIGSVGLIVIPFLDLIVNTETSIPNLELIYLLLLLNVVISYFFAFKRSLFIADQRNHVNSMNELLFNVIRTISQIIFLITTKSFIIYLVINVIVTFLSNLHISLKANKEFHFIDMKNAVDISREYRSHIFSRIKAVFSHKLGGVIVFGTDNILLSIFSGINFVGLYANYTVIVRLIMTPINQIFSSMTASVGNLGATESKEKSYQVFKKVFFLNYWLYGFSSVALFFLFNPFIKVWIGEKYLLNNTYVLLIVLNFYISGMRQSAGTFCHAKGLFWNTRFKPIIEALINLFFSVLLGYYFGAIGIFLGTLISLITTSMWVDAYVLYKNWFHKSVGIYFFQYFVMSCVIFLIAFILNMIIVLFDFHTKSFILLLIVIVVVTNILLFIIFYGTTEEKYYRMLVKSYIHKFYKKMKTK